MRKIFTFIWLSVVLISVGFSQSIKIKDPHEGAGWQRGKGYPINWTRTGKMHSEVKIRLYNSMGSMKILDITNNATNSGQFFWQIPLSVSPGKYIIRVKTIDNLVFDDSGIFFITSQITGTSTIKIITPGAGATWHKGKPQHISWLKQGSQDGLVKVRLFNPACTVTIKKIAENVPNNGSFHTPPGILDSIAPGDYVVRVKTMDNKVHGDSPVFSLKDPFGGFILKTDLNRRNPAFQADSGKHIPGIALAGQKIKFYAPRSGYVWKPLKDYEITFEVFKQSWPASSFYFDVKLVPAVPKAYFQDIFLKKKLQYKQKYTNHSYIYSFTWKFMGSYNIPTGKYKVLVQSITRPDLKGESEVISVDNQMGNNTGFIGEAEEDLEIEDVYYDIYKKSITARVRNKGFSPYSGEIRIGYDFTFSKRSTYNDQNCAKQTASDVKTYAFVSIPKQMTKVFHFYNYNCFDKRPADFIPKKGPLQYLVRVYHKGNKTAVKTGMICKTKKPDIIASSPIFVYTRHNTVIRLGPNLKGTMHPSSFNWISKNQFKTRVAVDVWNWGCTGKTFAVNLHMDGPYLNGKAGITLGMVSLKPGEEKHFVSQPVVFSIPRGPKYQRLLLVAHQGEKGDEGYPNAYMNNFLLANIRIHAENNTVRGNGW